MNTLCHQCQQELEMEQESEFGEFGNALPKGMHHPSRRPGLRYAASQLAPSMEMELAMELMSVSSEMELDHFLGKMFKKVWGGIKKVGSAVGKFVKPLGGALKALAKKALPFVGKALGTMIPIPGVGTAIGGALGSALSNALEMELAYLQGEEQEFEMARRFVRIAHSAASQVASAAPAQDVGRSVQRALIIATRRHAPAIDQVSRGAASIGSGGFGFSPNSNRRQGGWRRQAGNIVLEI